MRAHDYLLAQVPPWARPGNPMLRYMLQREERRHAPLIRLAINVIGAGVLIAVLLFSYRMAQHDTPLGLSSFHGSPLFAVLYFPLALVQFFAMLVAILGPANALAIEQARGTWETLKITSHGGELAIWARWAAMFYQLRWLLAIIVVPRLFFAGRMLVDLTAYQGRHLDLYLIGITPEVPLEAGLALLAAGMTASLVLPLALIGFNAALGLSLATVIRRRQIASLLRLAVVIGEWFAFGLALLVIDVNGRASWYTSDAGSWRDHVILALAGDHGLRLMDLRTQFEMWADVEYGVLVGGLVLVIVFALGLITNGLLRLAARHASLPGRE
jgi:hypothetical protein